MKGLLIFALILCAGVSFGQSTRPTTQPGMSMEEAQRRLQERIAKRSDPGATVSLADEISKLRAENALLKKEIERLQSLVDANAAAKAYESRPWTHGTGAIKVGMTASQLSDNISANSLIVDRSATKTSQQLVDGRTVQLKIMYIYTDVDTHTLITVWIENDIVTRRDDDIKDMAGYLSKYMRVKAGIPD